MLPLFHADFATAGGYRGPMWQMRQILHGTDGTRPTDSIKGAYLHHRHSAMPLHAAAVSSAISFILAL